MEISVVYHLREKRSEAKLTQVELERLSGIKQSFISMIENGHSQATLGTLFALVDGFNKSGKFDPPLTIADLVSMEVDETEEGQTWASPPGTSAGNHRLAVPA